MAVEKCLYFSLYVYLFKIFFRGKWDLVKHPKDLPHVCVSHINKHEF